MTKPTSRDSRSGKPFEAYRGNAEYVFVSYAHRDDKVAFPELARVKELGFNVWYDEGIKPGERWTEELAERISNCTQFIFLVTANSVASRICQDEVSFAIDGGKRFLAIHLEKTELSPGLQLRMGPQQAILRYDMDESTYARSLADALHERSSRVEPSATRAKVRPLTRTIGIAVALVVVAFAWYLNEATTVPIASSYTQLTRSQVVFPPEPSPYPLVADASRVYFNEWIAGGLGVRQISQTGGEATQVDLPFEDRDVEVLPQSMTPDRAQLLVSASRMSTGEKSVLWTLPVVGGTPRRLGEGSDAIYSPDGSQILYTDGFADFYLARSDLSEPRKLATMPGKIHWPRFSPEGERIRFTLAGRYGGQGLWEVAADGTGLRPVLPGWESHHPCCGIWTPDGRYFVFQATRNHRTQLWSMREMNGIFGSWQSEPVQITTGALEFRRPTIGPDGKTIFAIGWQLRGELMGYDSASERFAPLPGLESLSAEWLAFSRDEEWVAYVSYPEADLWRSKRNGTDRLQLTYPPMRTIDPVWSPDGQTLAFTGLMPGQQWRNYLVPAEGGKPTPATQNVAHQRFPSWSPDGKSLTFREGQKDKIQLLDRSTDTVTELEGSEGLRRPRWSPDGGYLAAFSNDYLQLFDVANGTRMQLAEVKNYDGHYWAHDGVHVYFTDFGERRVYRVNVQDRSVEEVASIGDTRQSWGAAGPWTGGAPDGSPILLRDLSIHHIYALDWLSD